MISDESLKLKSQVCFSLYACARRVARSYAPFLDPLGLTYTQYVTMMVLWEEEQITIRDLCQKLYLDSGTITPVLKKLVNDGYISKSRSGEDERVGIVKLTDKGKELYEKAKRTDFSFFSTAYRNEPGLQVGLLSGFLLIRSDCRNFHI